MDDRKKFKKTTKSFCLKLGKSKKILKKSINFLTELDKFNYSYLWTWAGVPIIQLPSEILVNQEIIFRTKPNIIIETGVARGGSILFYASILSLIHKKYKVIGIDNDLRPHNKKSIFNNPLSNKIKIIEGSSIEKKVLQKILKKIDKRDKVMVILDSNHSKKHVLQECKLYSKIVTKNCYLVVADTILGFFNKKQTPKKRSSIWHKGNEPFAAVKDFLKINKNYIIDKELNGKLIFSSSFNGYLKKIK